MVLEPLKTPIVEHAYRCPYCLISFNSEDGALKCISTHEMSSTITKIYEDGVAYGYEKLSGKNLLVRITKQISSDDEILLSGWFQEYLPNQVSVQQESRFPFSRAKFSYQPRFAELRTFIADIQISKGAAIEWLKEEKKFLSQKRDEAFKIVNDMEEKLKQNRLNLRKYSER